MRKLFNTYVCSICISREGIRNIHFFGGSNINSAFLKSPSLLHVTNIAPKQIITFLMF